MASTLPLTVALWPLTSSGAFGQNVGGEERFKDDDVRGAGLNDIDAVALLVDAHLSTAAEAALAEGVAWRAGAFFGFAGGGVAVDREAFGVDVEVACGGVEARSGRGRRLGRWRVDGVAEFFRRDMAKFFAACGEAIHEVEARDREETAGQVEGQRLSRLVEGRPVGALRQAPILGELVEVFAFISQLRHHEQLPRPINGHAPERAQFDCFPAFPDRRRADLPFGPPAFDQFAFGIELRDQPIAGVCDIDIAL